MEILKPSRRELLKGLGGIVLASFLPLSLAGCGDEFQDSSDYAGERGNRRGTQRGRSDNWLGTYDITTVWGSGSGRSEEEERERINKRRDWIAKAREAGVYEHFIELSKEGVKVFEYGKQDNGEKRGGISSGYYFSREPMISDAKFVGLLGSGMTKSSKASMEYQFNNGRLEVTSTDNGEILFSFLAGSDRYRSEFYSTKKR